MEAVVAMLSVIGGLFFSLLLYVYIKGLLTLDAPDWLCGGRSVSMSSIEEMHK